MNYDEVNEVKDTVEIKWETVYNPGFHPQEPGTEAFITIKHKNKKMYFSQKMVSGYLTGFHWVILRVASQAKILSIQPTNRKIKDAKNGNMTYKIVYHKGHGSGAVACARIFGYDFVPRKTTRYTPYWDSQKEWLTINFNGKNNDPK